MLRLSVSFQPCKATSRIVSNGMPPRSPIVFGVERPSWDAPAVVSLDPVLRALLRRGSGELLRELGYLDA